jgi:uncharacterized protein (TIGR00645 family)
MSPPPRPFVERLLEETLFASRWLLSFFYLGLALGLVVLVVSFIRKFIALAARILTVEIRDAILSVLALIDLSLIANLVLIVMLSGFNTFIARMDLNDRQDRPIWIAKIGYHDLKLKLLASIIAISAVQLLEIFMHVEDTTNHVLAWSIALHVTFLVSGVMLAVMDRISGSHD